MAGFMAALVAVALTSFGGRDQLLLARMSAKLGQAQKPATALMMVGWATTIITSIVMAFAAVAVAGMMTPAARAMLVALALLFAAIELAIPDKKRKLDEPTHSLGALFIVLLARQLTDSARFIVFAMAIYGNIAWLAALGGALAGGAGLTLGWILGEEMERAMPLRAIRIALAVVIGAAAIYIGLSARGLIG